MGIVLSGRDLSPRCNSGSWAVCSLGCLQPGRPTAWPSAAWLSAMAWRRLALALKNPAIRFCLSSVLCSSGPPVSLLQVAVPQTPRPPTVADPQFDAQPRNLTLNEAINITLANSEVVRVLSGVTASTSGRTIYDVAITNTTIDQQKGVFDPTLRFNNVWNQVENPIGIPDPLNPGKYLDWRNPK